MSVIGEIVQDMSREIARLRAALQKIVDDPGGHPAEGIVDDMKYIAREALGMPQPEDE